MIDTPVTPAETLAWGRLCVIDALDALEMSTGSGSITFAVERLNAFLRASEQYAGAQK